MFGRAERYTLAPFDKAQNRPFDKFILSKVKGLRTGLPMTSWAVRLSSRQSLKRLAEGSTALEDPSTGPFGEAQDRLRAGAGVGRGRGRTMLWLSEAETVAKLILEGKNKLLEMMRLHAQRG